MQRTVVLLRHAQTSWNVEGRFNSTADIGITPFGEEQAGAAATSLARLAPFTFVRSTARRAQETAAPLAASIGHEPAVDPRMAEVDFGPFEGRRPAEVRQDPAFISWHEGRLPGADAHAHADVDADAIVDTAAAAADAGVDATAAPEPLEVAAARAQAGLEEALAADPDAGTIVVVSHGVLLRALLCRVVFDLPATAFRRFVLDNARAAVLRYDAAETPPRLLAMNVSPADVPDLPDA